MGVNKVILLARLGKDPEVKQFDNGSSVCNLSLATEKTWVDKSGAKQTAVTWHKVVAFGKIGENCSKYLNKGSQVFVEGELTTREWEKNGEKRYSTEIIAQSVQFLSGKGETNSQTPSDKKQTLDDMFV